MPQDFSATVDAWVAQTRERMAAVVRTARQDVVDVMQTPVASGGAMPVKLGFLRASLVAGPEDQPPALTENKAKASVTYNAGEVGLVIANSDVGDNMAVFYTARYARRVNYGFTGEDSLGRTYNQKGAMFVELAAQQWPRIVEEAAAKAKALAGA